MLSRERRCFVHRRRRFRKTWRRVRSRYDRGGSAGEVGLRSRERRLEHGDKAISTASMSEGRTDTAAATSRRSCGSVPLQEWRDHDVFAAAGNGCVHGAGPGTRTGRSGGRGKLRQGQCPQNSARTARCGTYLWLFLVVISWFPVIRGKLVSTGCKRDYWQRRRRADPSACSVSSGRHRSRQISPQTRRKARRARQVRS